MLTSISTSQSFKLSIYIVLVCVLHGLLHSLCLFLMCANAYISEVVPAKVFSASNVIY